MAKKDAHEQATATEPEIPQFVRPEGLISLTKRYAQYDPGIDARDRRNKGQRGAPLHGLLVGSRSLPATIADPVTGELKPWDVLVIELLQPAPVKEAGSNPNEDKRRIAMPPEHIIITSSTAINSIRERYGLDAAIESPDLIFELYVEPEASQTKAGFSLWTFPTFEMGKPRKRTESQQINPFAGFVRGQLASGQATRGALPQGSGHPAAAANPVTERTASPV